MQKINFVFGSAHHFHSLRFTQLFCFLLRYYKHWEASFERCSKKSTLEIYKPSKFRKTATIVHDSRTWSNSIYKEILL